ncbi:T9SS type A sorting domain-containing protein [Salegentibacter sp. F188]|uniref:T9SS type A sorting domain-containing protein n=1 Tax=Autumnicola patrickiae TaxID=3075591 RepID=A0ABU3DYM6_9FLAO|nr:T9SS type A sorting domain-containing protein [Salegentibacter sp. F188]MDT0688823.1 T9SS type A sorting domain-containing protein [Salegentibacter sp. F188]
MSNLPLTLLMKYLSLLLILFLPHVIQAQEEQPEANPGYTIHNVIVPSGGDANGDGGSVAFTLGQVFYLTYEDTDNSINEGIQQPFLNASEEVPAVVDESNPPGDETDKNLPPSIEVIAYPNPMTEFFIIEISNFKAEGYSYQFFDLHGRLLELGPIENRRTKISPSNLGSAMYILKVFKQNKNIKTFKILKR